MATYVLPNYRNKKALIKAVREGGIEIRVVTTGPDAPPRNGQVAVEGPHYPETVEWRAVVTVLDGTVIRVVR